MGPLHDRGGVSQGEYVLTASLADAGYALSDDVSALAVTVRLGDAESYTALPSGDPLHPDYITSGVSPNGTTIDLFDYWLTSQTAPDANDPWDGKENKTYTSGINDGHALLFTASASSREKSGVWNQWTGDESPCKGIVQNKLGKDGYPVLNNLDTAGLTGISDRDGNESLAYLFSPNVSSEGKASYEDVQGLLQVDEDGYYSYDSQKNYAVYYEDTNSFTLYSYPGVRSDGAAGADGQFFPFNAATSDPKEPGGWRDPASGLMNENLSTDASLNHYFGVHMSTRFIQQYNGHTDDTGRQAVTYEFSGDDDVWIFIDDTLVADLGGIHNAASVGINFATGEITINGETQKQTLGELLGLGSDILTNNTYHTLDFFYLERGNVDSNMDLKYNLVTIPESGLIKVDQVGDAVQGAEFALYAAEDYEQNGADDTMIATGITDDKGEFVFLDNDAMPIRLQDLYEQYSEGEDRYGNNLILVETQTPPGYRSGGPIGLYFYRSPADENEVLLLSNSVWTEGAYAMPKVTATAPNKIYEANGGEESAIVSGADAEKNPLMFAVVFQKQSDGEWLPIYGDPINGWHVAKSAEWSDIKDAAQKNPYVFQIASSGAYQVEIDNLPGDIKTYYHLLAGSDKNNAKYTIAYYYTSGDSLTQIESGNTWRIDTELTGVSAFDRVFSMDLYVTNMKNCLLVQKVDDESNTIAGAEFALYKASVVSFDNGVATVKPGATSYDNLVTENISVDSFKLDGGGVFPTEGHVLELGEYYLIETSTPKGYRKNETPIHIVVDNTGVYADAGISDDGVSVLSGVGSIMRSMVQFAADDNVDTTLHDIKAAMAASVKYKDSGSFTVNDSDWNSASVKHFAFSASDKMLDYGLAGDGGDTNSTIDNLTFATDEGWSKLLIRQDKYEDNSLKTNLKDQDITNLFSGTVTVRVANEKVGDLTISKIVKGNAGDRNKGFVFAIIADTSIDGKYECAWTPEDILEECPTFDKGKASVTLKHGQSITIKNLPAASKYVYSVKEENVSSDGYDTTFTFTQMVPSSGGETDEPTVSTGNRAADFALANLGPTTVTFTNTRTAAIPTGLPAENTSWLWIAGIAGFGGTALVITGKLSGAKRRKGRHAQ